MKPVSKLSLTFLLGLAVILPQVPAFPEFNTVGDASGYIAMAEGKPQGVVLYHARRILHPWLVSLLSPLVGIDGGFFVIGTLALLLFVWTLLTLPGGILGQRYLWGIPLFTLPYLFDVYHGLYLPTLLFLALSGLYWLCLAQKKLVMSLAILFFLSLTRFEETAIIALSAVIVSSWLSFKHPQKRRVGFYAVSVVLLMVVGIVVITYLTRSNVTRHLMPLFPLLVLRVPLFLVRSFLGFEHWVDNYRALPFYTHEPLLAFETPVWVQTISHIKEWGVYEWNPFNIVSTAGLILCAFGTCPTLLGYYLKKKSINFSENPLFITTALLTGCLSFILAPTMGPPSLRYYLPAWPAFFIITPIFLKPILDADKNIATRCLLYHAICGWMLFPVFRATGLLFPSLLLLVIAYLHFATWRSLSNLSESTCRASPSTL